MAITTNKTINNTQPLTIWPYREKCDYGTFVLPFTVPLYYIHTYNPSNTFEPITMYCTGSLYHCIRLSQMGPLTYCRAGNVPDEGPRRQIILTLIDYATLPALCHIARSVPHCPLCATLPALCHIARSVPHCPLCATLPALCHIAHSVPHCPLCATFARSVPHCPLCATLPGL